MYGWPQSISIFAFIRVIRGPVFSKYLIVALTRDTHTLGFVIFHVCASDGERIGEFEENDFREKLFGKGFPADSYYWHEGMEDWRPVIDYRSLAKTQRISFAPPMRRTVKIDMEQEAAVKPEKSESSLRRFWRRLTGH